MLRIFFVLLSLFCFSFADDVAKSAKNAAWIKLEGDVDPGMNDYVRRAIAEATAKNPDIIVFEVNTFGGRLDAAFDIVDTITALKIPTVSLVRQKAISAGALIALSSNKLYMLPSTTIGDCAPIVQSNSGEPQIVGEKIQSPLRAKFRNLAERNGYPALLMEAMVSPDLAVMQLSDKDSSFLITVPDYNDLSEDEQKKWATKKTLVREGELLTMTNEEAKNLKFSQATVKDEEELKQLLGIQKIVIIKISWAEELTRIIGSLSGLLMILGFGALYLEFKTPGFGIFGIIGVTLLAIVFLGQYASSLHDKLPLVLLCLGTVLMLLEIFVLPGMMVCGALGILCFIAALAMSFDVSSLPSFMPSIGSIAGWQYGLIYILVCAVLALSLPILASKYLLPLLPDTFTPINKSDLATAHSPVEEFVEQVHAGDIGLAYTDLRPSGKAVFGDKYFDAQSRGDFIEANTKIVIDAVEAGKLWVRKG